MKQMIKMKNVNNNAGFSLIELMVVVAIIGVLASIAVPSVGKYMAKAKQSEAKANLSSYYMSEKAFFAEYNSFDSRFGAIGFSPEGKLAYNLGSAAFNAPAANYTQPGGLNTSITTAAYCGAAPAFVNGCSIMGPVQALAGQAMTQSTFIAATAAIIRAGVFNVDRWTIDENKVLSNRNDGTQ